MLKNRDGLQITVIPNGFNISQLPFQQQQIENTELQLITVGTLSQRKGQHNVIKALPQILIKHPKVMYHMVGIPSDEKLLRQLAIDLGVLEHIKIHGALNQETMVELLGNSSIFMMLSEKDIFGAVEGFGIALLEANYVGVPTIGSVNCGIEDAIDDGKSGLLIDPFDKDAICNSIDLILKNKVHYKEHAREWALKHEWSEIIKRYYSFIEL